MHDMHLQEIYGVCICIYVVRYILKKQKQKKQTLWKIAREGMDVYMDDNGSFLLQGIDDKGLGRRGWSWPDKKVGGAAGVKASFSNKPANEPC